MHINPFKEDSMFRVTPYDSALQMLEQEENRLRAEPSQKLPRCVGAQLSNYLYWSTNTDPLPNQRQYTAYRTLLSSTAKHILEKDLAWETIAENVVQTCQIEEIDDTKFWADLQEFFSANSISEYALKKLRILKNKCSTSQAIYLQSERERQLLQEELQYWTSLAKGQCLPEPGDFAWIPEPEDSLVEGALTHQKAFKRVYSWVTRPYGRRHFHKQSGILILNQITKNPETSENILSWGPRMHKWNCFVQDYSKMRSQQLQNRMNRLSSLLAFFE